LAGTGAIDHNGQKSRARPMKTHQGISTSSASSRRNRRTLTSTKPKRPAKIRRRNAAITRARILDAAKHEFAARGLKDGRIEDVAKRARANRRMIYYYFGSKDALYLAALESVYAELMDEERKVDVDNLDPVDAITEIVRLKIEHYVQHPEFISFLNIENLYGAKHLRHSNRIADFRAPLTDILARVLKRGQRSGLFRSDIDPVDLYISVCALGYLYFSNKHTFGVIFGRDLTAPPAVKRRKGTITDMIMRYLRVSEIDG
jgi:AcrR family transcriptional regulator